MMVTHNQAFNIVKDMIKFSKEIDQERIRINYQSPDNDNAYITYREGYYDACLDFLTNVLNYSTEEIEEMENEEKSN
ncbi:hypothetical protein P9265_19495 [Schinkia azotoformans]|uniref:hypothetical protein n=1 Tax=Schinkia azotoformans TaxID=1454 RepID=UPI002E1F9095|nr:hypothetical protein [Schinkia azotoformans]